MKIPQSIKQLKRQQLEELCLKLMSTNHMAVHRANYYEDMYTAAIDVLNDVPLDMPCDYDEKWYEKRKPWCEEHCDQACECGFRICWDRYVEDRMCENEGLK